MPCPASAAAGAETPMCLSTKLYDSQELEQHCLEVHRIFRFKGLSAAALPKPSSRSSKRALEAQAVATSGIEGAQFRVDNSDGGGDENEQDMTTSKRDQTPIRRKRQHSQMLPEIRVYKNVNNILLSIALLVKQQAS